MIHSRYQESIKRYVGMGIVLVREKVEWNGRVCCCRTLAGYRYVGQEALHYGLCNVTLT